MNKYIYSLLFCVLFVGSRAEAGERLANLLVKTPKNVTMRTCPPMETKKFNDFTSSAVTIVKGSENKTLAVDFPRVKYGTATGVSGFYDYQSNGRSPRYLFITPDGTFNNLNVCMMTATDSTDTTKVSSSRRVGYGYSSDGGVTWVSTNDVTAGQERLGFPCVTSTPGFITNGKEAPIVVAHAGGGSALIHSVAYVGDELGQTTFAGVPGPDTSAGGRPTTIWPTAVPTKAGDLLVTATVYLASTADPAAPIQTSTFSHTTDVFSDFKNLGDSNHTYGSGGDEVTAVSPQGKIGVAYMLYAADSRYGIWFCESTDGGATFSLPSQIVSAKTNTNPPLFDPATSPDTLFFGGNLDLIYQGETPHVVFNAAWENLYRGEGIWHWTAALGAQLVMQQDSNITFGATVFGSKTGQPSMAPISYPTIGAGDDGKRLMIVCQAAYQDANRALIDTLTTTRFAFNQLFCATSIDGGASWGQTTLINGALALNQGDVNELVDFEYPHLAPLNHTVGDTTFYNLVYMVRRHPGMYAFTASGGTAGPINRTYLYYQSVHAGSASVGDAQDINPPKIVLNSSTRTFDKWGITDSSNADVGIRTIVVDASVNYTSQVDAFTACDPQTPVFISAQVTDSTKDAAFKFTVTDCRGNVSSDSIEFTASTVPDLTAPVIAVVSSTASSKSWKLTDAQPNDIGIDRVNVVSSLNCESAIGKFARCSSSEVVTFSARMIDVTKDAKLVFLVRDCQGNSAKDSVSFVGKPFTLPDTRAPKISLTTSTRTYAEWGVTDNAAYDGGIRTLTTDNSVNYTTDVSAFSACDPQSVVFVTAQVTDTTKDAAYKFTVTDCHGNTSTDSISFIAGQAPDNKSPVIAFVDSTKTSKSWKLTDTQTNDVGIDRVSIVLNTNCDYTVSTFARCSATELVTLSAHMIDTTQNAKFVFLVRDCQGNSALDSASFIGVPLSVQEDGSGVVPASISLLQNYPNPFNPATNIAFGIPTSGVVHLSVYDMLGGLVATLVNSTMSAGQYVAEFNANRLASGMYTSVLEFGGKRISHEMLLSK